VEIPIQWTRDEAAMVSVRSLCDALGWGMLTALLLVVPLTVLFARVVRRRRFWCSRAHRDVVVEFADAGLPGMRRSANVWSCTAFDPPTAVTCRRECVDPEFREPCEGPAVVGTRWRR
jgi:hypothetical protein